MRMTNKNKKKQRTPKEEGWKETHTQMHTNTQKYECTHAQIRTNTRTRALLYTLQCIHTI